MPFGSDALLWYNVGDWAPLGFAVPNFGNDTTSQNSTIRQITEQIGRNLQAVMFQPDAMLRTPPSINTLTKIHKLCDRIRSILAGRAVPSGQLNLEPQHALPAPEEFIVFPCPYFEVRNQWLKEYAGYALTALTEAFQHQENGRPIEISLDFAGSIGQYIKRIYRNMATELFDVPSADASKDDFKLSDAQLASYNPSKFFTSTELIDTPPDFSQWPTEDDLKVLTDGIPVSQLPKLGRWPNTAGSSTPSSSGSTGTPTGSTGAAFAPAPGA